jgi:hypothetical protein
MSGSTDARRRWFGLLCLVVALGMLIWGETVLKDRLRGLVFLAYWLVCFVVTGLAILTAILDMRATRRQSREEQRNLIEQAWKDINNKPNDWDRIK